MPMQVVNTAVTMCSFGLAPGTLVITPENCTLSSNQPAATIMDFIPMKNIMPFGMCMSPGNPAFVAATSAALGTPTPVPCIPATSSPWAPGSPTVMIKNLVALNDTSTCTCSLGGVITISFPGQVTHQIP